MVDEKSHAAESRSSLQFLSRMHGELLEIQNLLEEPSASGSPEIFNRIHSIACGIAREAAEHELMELSRVARQIEGGAAQGASESRRDRLEVLARIAEQLIALDDEIKRAVVESERP